MNSLKETESLSSEQELDFLQSLLESKELNALVNVHSKVAKVGKDDRLAPLMSSSLQVCKFSKFFFYAFAQYMNHITVLKLRFSSLYFYFCCLIVSSSVMPTNGFCLGCDRSVGTSVTKMSYIGCIKGNFYVATTATSAGKYFEE